LIFCLSSIQMDGRQDPSWTVWLWLFPLQKNCSLTQEGSPPLPVGSVRRPSLPNFLLHRLHPPRHTQANPPFFSPRNYREGGFPPIMSRSLRFALPTKVAAGNIGPVLSSYFFCLRLHPPPTKLSQLFWGPEIPFRFIPSKSAGHLAVKAFSSPDPRFFPLLFPNSHNHL